MYLVSFRLLFAVRQGYLAAVTGCTVCGNDRVTYWKVQRKFEILKSSTVCNVERPRNCHVKHVIVTKTPTSLSILQNLPYIALTEQLYVT